MAALITALALAAKLLQISISHTMTLHLLVYKVTARLLRGAADNPSNSRFEAALARYISEASNTPMGTGVVVQPVDSSSGSTPALLTFSQVTQVGITSLAT